MAKLLHENEYATLLADAERYRFIRAKYESSDSWCQLFYAKYCNTNTPGFLDQIIDLLRGK